MFRTLRTRKQLQEQIRIVSESRYFDRKWYLDNNPDVYALNKDPAKHYVKHAWVHIWPLGPSPSLLGQCPGLVLKHYS